MCKNEPMFVTMLRLSRPIMTVIFLIALVFMFLDCHELAKIIAIVVVGMIVFRFAMMFLFFDKAKIYFNREHAEGVFVCEKMCEPLNTLLPPPYFTIVKPITLKMVWPMIISAEIIGSGIFIVLFLWVGLI